MSHSQPQLGLSAGAQQGPVECLGIRFESDDARRIHFLRLLREKLQDPEFRKTPGFPSGSDEDILRISDPPYYTACPNPFLSDLIGATDAGEGDYNRTPYASDIAEGKRHPLYEHVSYHTKVPHRAIAKYIEHYTKPGDLVVDLFGGSGMTGLASKTVHEIAEPARATPGELERRAVVNDLSPYATFMAHHFSASVGLPELEEEFEEVERSLEWMYLTRDPDGCERRINYTVWSDVFACANCGGEIVFFKEFVDPVSGDVQEQATCKACDSLVTKHSLASVWETVYDDLLRGPVRRLKQSPVLIKYFGAGGRHRDKVPDAEDLARIIRVAETPIPAWVPVYALPVGYNTEQPRRSHGVSHVHHFFTRRNLIAIASLWSVARRHSATRWMFELLSGFRVWTRRSIFLTKAWKQGGTGAFKPSTSGILYFPSISGERNVFANFAERKKEARAFVQMLPSEREPAMITTASASRTGLADGSVDYIFIDPPFGANIMYSELNVLFESWLGVITTNDEEAIENPAQGKDLAFYTSQMRACMSEAYRILKPGRWITVEFHNSKNIVWHAIQEAVQSAGFVVADVSVLDKKQGTFKQYTSVNSMRKDLVISAYKPARDVVGRKQLGSETQDAAWVFVAQHLGHLPVVDVTQGELSIVAERTPYLLFDRMVGYFVRRGIAVPIGGPDFFSGLAQRYPSRDGMYFLPAQVHQYDRARSARSGIRQLTLFVTDEASAIQWVRQQIQDKPQTFEALQPAFMRQQQAWARHEWVLDLREVLRQNFLLYSGSGPVPSQIHSYLSSNFADLRNLGKEDSRLQQRATDRWYVPDPGKQADLDQLRERSLLKEFAEYKESTQRKLKLFRTEAIRAGFKACWQERDYTTIVKVAEKLPDAVLQEDEKLLMYYDNALTRMTDA
jgi:DNA modification methylase